MLSCAGRLSSLFPLNRPHAHFGTVLSLALASCLSTLTVPAVKPVKIYQSDLERAGRTSIAPVPRAPVVSAREASGTAPKPARSRKRALRTKRDAAAHSGSREENPAQPHPPRGRESLRHATTRPFFLVVVAGAQIRASRARRAGRCRYPALITFQRNGLRWVSNTGFGVPGGAGLPAPAETRVWMTAPTKPVANQDAFAPAIGIVGRRHATRRPIDSWNVGRPRTRAGLRRQGTEDATPTASWSSAARGGISPERPDLRASAPGLAGLAIGSQLSRSARSRTVQPEGRDRI
ncbi:hypothetical protein DFH07DRAFT_1010742 [Mycena maculata]|uniref:Uncharacterized protein n=1 Tax=Mycena maculata TaxID=230809 RepID=A0AAD7KDC4_9AGAR|nr:hypothetical protein DFH07DRAFT_1010742 [Mycena maculata]